jgi:xylose dehydrogenase (NAD/NADP)
VAEEAQSTALRWGVLATADIAATVVDACRDSEPVTFTAVASRDGARAAEFAAAHGLTHSFGSYADLLASDEVDAVYVALPISMHVPWAVAALEAGKHVLCEKPFATTATDVVVAFDAAEMAGRVLVEGLMWRHHPQTALARRLVADGAIGDLQHVRATLAVSVPRGDIRRTAALGGGGLYDLGCYCVSAIRLFAGEPSAVMAEAVWGAEADGEQDVDLRLAAVLRLPEPVTGGVRLGQFDVGVENVRRDELELIGTEGVLVVPDPWLCRSSALELRRGGRVEQHPVDTSALDPLRASAGEDAVYRLELERVTATMTGASTGEFGRADAIGQAATLEALRASAEQGTRVQLPA